MTPPREIVGLDETLESSPEIQLPISDPLADHDAFAAAESDRYEFAGELGRGGMGRIVIARDRRLRRPVALKELLTIERPDAVRRFVREALITARLQHPSIVRLYDAGRFANGQQFFSLEMVRGLPFDKVIGKCRTLDERLALLPNLIAACDALAYAHAQRVIHRDLKPANILCGSYGETVVIDWGLAKDLGEPELSGEAPPADGTDPTLEHSDANLTREGAVMGTPSYMPPEQARGEVVDERADVFALGAMLYTLLSGSSPYKGRSAQEVLARVLRGPPDPLEEKEPDAPPELCAIALKAMAYAKADRYTSATQLTEELRRFQTGQLVAAHRYSRGELARRFVRRNRGPVVIAAAALGVLTLGGSLSVARVLTERDRARTAEALALSAQRALEHQNENLVFEQARQALLHDPTRALAWLRELGRSTTRLAEAQALARDACALGVARLLRGHKDDVSHLQHAGPLLLSASDDQHLRLWNVAEGVSHDLAGHTAQIGALAVSHDGKHAASGSVDQTVRLWNLSGQGSEVLLGHHGSVRDLAFSPDDSRLASASEDQTVRVWDLASHKSRILTFHRGGVRSLAYGRQALYSGGEDGQLVRWDHQSYAPRVVGRHNGTVRAVRLSPDRRWIASAGEDGQVQLFDAEGTGAPRRLLQSHDVVKTLAFSADSEWLAAAGNEGVVRLWHVGGADATDPRPEAIELKGHEAGIKALAFSPDGTQLASSGADRTIFLWDLAKKSATRLRGHGAAVKSLTFLPDGTLASASDDDTIRVWLLAARPPTDPRALPNWLGQLVPWRVTEFDGAR